MAWKDVVGLTLDECASSLDSDCGYATLMFPFPRFFFSEMIFHRFDLLGGIALALALIAYGAEDQADGIIEQLSRSKVRA